MKKNSFILLFCFLISMCLSGCGPIGDKMTSMSIIYGMTAVISLMLLIVFNCIIPKRDMWYQLLFSAIFIVNLGYFTLSVSTTLEEALLANRISYLGSVFLPMSMFLLILNTSKIKYQKWLPIVLLVIGVVVFLIAASPGYSDIYYKEVFLTAKNGATILKKVYGPLHSIYLFYLLGYFSVMVTTLVYATKKKPLNSSIQSVMLLSAVLINIFVWMIEQLIHVDFEMLSVSYIISELFLISLQLMSIEYEKAAVPKEPAALPLENVSLENAALENVSPESILTPDTAYTNTASDDTIDIKATADEPASEADTVSEDCLHTYMEGLAALTPTERIIYNLYIGGSTTKEIMSNLNIKENTLKFHNKNIYGKLGVSSRKQLIELSKQLDTN